MATGALDEAAVDYDQPVLVGAEELSEERLHPAERVHPPAVQHRFVRVVRKDDELEVDVALAEQLVGIREVDDQVWQVSFLEYDLGYFDRDQDRVEPGPNPFAPDTVLTMCPE